MRMEKCYMYVILFILNIDLLLIYKYKTYKTDFYTNNFYTKRKYETRDICNNKWYDNICSLFISKRLRAICQLSQEQNLLTL